MITIFPGCRSSAGNGASLSIPRKIRPHHNNQETQPAPEMLKKARHEAAILGPGASATARHRSGPQTQSSNPHSSHRPAPRP
jgi:hypothetical protein